jgi:hypothetical protein
VDLTNATLQGNELQGMQTFGSGATFDSCTVSIIVGQSVIQEACGFGMDARGNEVLVKNCKVTNVSGDRSPTLFLPKSTKRTFQLMKADHNNTQNVQLKPVQARRWWTLEFLSPHKQKKKNKDCWKWSKEDKQEEQTSPFKRCSFCSSAGNEVFEGRREWWWRDSRFPSEEVRGVVEVVPFLATSIRLERRGRLNGSPSMFWPV